jgi:hypothetical protein
VKLLRIPKGGNKFVEYSGVSRAEGRAEGGSGRILTSIAI